MSDPSIDVTQAVVVSGATPDASQAFARLALFNEDGTELSLSGDTVLDLDPASPTTDLIIATGFGAGMAWLGAGTSAQRPTMYEKDGRINVEGEMKIAGGATTEQLNDLSSGSVKLIEFPRNYTAPKDIDHAIMVQVAGEAHPMLVYIYNDGAGLSVWCDGPSTAPAWFAPNAYITFEFSFPGSIDPPS